MSAEQFKPLVDHLYTKFVETEDLKQLINKYNEFIEKATKIANRYAFYGDFTGTHFYYGAVPFDENDITIMGDDYCCGECSDADYTFPITWLFMSDEEIDADKVRRDKIKEEELAKRRAEQEAKERAKKEAEERALYEELKKKYGES